MGAARFHRTEESAKLLNYGYRALCLCGRIRDRTRGSNSGVKGQEDSVSVVAESNPMLILPDELKDRLDRRDSLPEHLIAPVQHRQVVGEYVVALDGRNLATIALVADRSVERAGLGKVLTHSFQLLDPKQKKLYIWAAVIIAILILGRLYIAYLRYKRRRRRSRFRLARD